MATTAQRLFDIKRKQAARDSDFEPIRDIRRGYIIEVNGSIEGSREGYVWFKSLETDTPPREVFNPGEIQNVRANMYCEIERNPKEPARWQILRFDTGVYFDDQSTYETLPGLSGIGPHGADHEYVSGRPGSDPVTVYPRAISDFAVRPTSPASMKVRIYGGWYPGSVNYEKFSGPVNSKDFTADIPGTAGRALIEAITIDAGGTIGYVTGSLFVDGLPVPASSLPSVGTDVMIISAIRLVNGMTEIAEANFDVEIRPVFGPGALAGSIDRAKVTKLISPDGLTDPVLSADNAGDVTLATGGDLILPDGIVHSGDTDTLVSFGADQIDLQAGGNVIVSLDAAGLKIVPAALPGSPAAGDLVIDSGAGNTLKWYDGAGWQTALNLWTDKGGGGGIYYNGDVGIGDFSSDSIDFPLQVIGRPIVNDEYAAHSEFRGRSANGTQASPTDVVADDTLVQITGWGYKDGAFRRATLLRLETESTATNEVRGRYEFWTQNASSLAERVRIDSDGNVGIGTASPTRKLTVSGSGNDVLLLSGGSGRSGFAEATNITGTAQVLIQNDAYDITQIVSGFIVIYDSTFGVTSSTFSLNHTFPTSLTLSISTTNYALRLNADGSLDIRRTAGASTASVAINAVWI